MSKLLKSVVALVTTICLSTAVFGEAGKNDAQDAEVKFNIQLTSALNNDPEAQYLVAEMYAQGVGTPQNLRMAHLWYTKSARQGHAAAIEKLDNWEKARQESESVARGRAEELKRRQAEAEAATAAKTAREEAAAKAARGRAEELKRRQAEAEAATAAKTAREEAAAKAARERAEELKRRQAEAEAATAAKTAREEPVKPAKPTEIPPVAKDSQTTQPKDKPKDTAAKKTEKAAEEFRANPCKTPTAKFTSVCQ